MCLCARRFWGAKFYATLYSIMMMMAHNLVWFYVYVSIHAPNDVIAAVTGMIEPARKKAAAAEANGRQRSRGN